MNQAGTATEEMGDLARLYDAEYYRSHLGPVPYSRESPAIMNFFSTVAEHLTRSLNPKTVLDAGCAMGFLVESLWDRGVEAWGFDLSPFAISQVRMDIRPYCSVASVADPINGQYDLITCMEVLEHVPEGPALQAIENLTKATNTILFSSSATDFGEPTHVTVRQPMWWLSRFAAFGFYPDLLFDCTFASPQAMLMRRSEQPQPYEVLRLFSNLVRFQTRAISAEVRDHEHSVAAHQAQNALSAAQSQITCLTGEVSRLNEVIQKLTEQISRQSTEITDSEKRAMLEQLNGETRSLREALGVTHSETIRRGMEIASLSTETDRLRDQLSHQDKQLAELEKQVAEWAVWERKRELLLAELSQTQQAFDALTTRQAALETQSEAAMVEAERAGGLAERAEQRNAILLQQIERCVGAITEINQSVAMQKSRWEDHFNNQRGISFNVESRYGQLSSTMQSIVPRLSETQARVEELTRLNIVLHQQVHGFSIQLRDILQSRIWQGLVRAGGIMLKLTGRKP